ncbi:lysophosphatidic acid receptor 3-like [Styela clava]
MDGGSTPPHTLCGVKNNTFDNIISGGIDLALSVNCTIEPDTTGLEPRNEKMYCEPIESAPLAIVSGLVATATIVGNLLVILAILRGSSRFHRPMFWLIIHLSCADLIVGFMLLWNYCLASLMDIHNTITSLMFIFSLWVASESSSTLGFVLLAVDRYIQIFHKNFHRAYATRVTVGIAIFLAWAIPVSFFMIAPFAFDWSCKDTCICSEEKYMKCLPRSDCSQIIPPFKKTYTLTVGIFLFICIPLPVTIYTMIFIRFRRKTHVVKHTRKRHDMRLIRTLIVILAVFIVTLSPVAILIMVDYTTTRQNDTMISVAFYIFVLAFLNSLANPLLYMWRMSAIRRSIRQRVFYCFWDKHGKQRRDITSFQSDQRSPTSHRHRYDTPNDIDDKNHKYVPPNNNMPRAAVLCLRQIKRGRYTNSRTSTPMSERANNHNEEAVKLAPNEPNHLKSNGTSQEGDVIMHNSCNNKADCEITEL